MCETLNTCGGTREDRAGGKDAVTGSCSLDALQRDVAGLCERKTIHRDGKGDEGDETASEEGGIEQ